METMIAPQALHFTAGTKTPNNPTLPVLIYREIIQPLETGKDKIFQKHFEKNGWHGTWKGVIYDYNHFHSNAHEALGIARGHVTVRLGGETGKEIELKTGDLLVLPAGTGHQMIAQSESLKVIGSYPAGQENYDICRSLSEDSNIQDRIAKLPLPQSDPFYGNQGPLLNLWYKTRINIMKK